MNKYIKTYVVASLFALLFLMPADFNHLMARGGGGRGEEGMGGRGMENRQMETRQMENRALQDRELNNAANNAAGAGAYNGSQTPTYNINQGSGTTTGVTPITPSGAGQ